MSTWSVQSAPALLFFFYLTTDTLTAFGGGSYRQPIASRPELIRSIVPAVSIVSLSARRTLTCSHASHTLDTSTVATIFSLEHPARLSRINAALSNLGLRDKRIGLLLDSCDRTLSAFGSYISIVVDMPPKQGDDGRNSQGVAGDESRDHGQHEVSILAAAWNADMR